MTDDIWDSEAEVPPEQVRVERNQNNHGFLEGVTSIADISLQQGFDSGYIEGSKLGIQIGQIIGTLQHFGEKELETQALNEMVKDPARIPHWQAISEEVANRPAESATN